MDDNRIEKMLWSLNFILIRLIIAFLSYIIII